MNLDSIQQQAFVKYYSNLHEKPPTTVRIYDRNDYYSVHGIDATTAAREVFSSTSNIKKMGLKPNTLDYLVLSKGNFETLVKKLLLVKRYRVEIYTNTGSARSCEWELTYKGSPGCLYQLEELLGEGLGASEDGAGSLMAVNIRTDPVTKGRLIGVACVVSAEFELSVTEFTDDDLMTELEAITVQLAPSECVVPLGDTDEYKNLKKVMDRANVTITKLKKSEFCMEGLIQDLNRLLKFKDSQHQDANIFPEVRKEVAMGSLNAAIKYMSLMTDNTNFGRYRIMPIQAECFLHLDAAALSALNIFPELGDNSHSPARSLYGLLDRCRTAHGKRLLAQWLRQPLRDIHLINERLDVVQALVDSSQVRLQLYGDHLRRIPDLHALARRLTRKKANLQDCYRIYQAISRLPSLLQCLAELNSSTVHSSLAEPIAELSEDLAKFQQMIETTLDMDAVEKGDYLVKPSFDEQLESMRDQLDKLQTLAERELGKAARDLGLEAGKTIKLDNNPQNGFFFRVTLKEEQSLRGNKKFKIIDAVKGGVRFKTDALDSITEDYVQTKTNYEKEQDKVVTEIVGIAAGYSDCLALASRTLSRLDALCAFAVAASTAPHAYCRPTLSESLDELTLRDARHPCVELMEGVSYIANDVCMQRDKSLMHIVTGANMGGKSTWMRSAGAIAVMAHAGSLVPCSSATIPRLRAICARVGASDCEKAGLSTFMQEMCECASILKTATPDSLVLVDELGRGTSTYEGCGIAWAIAEELATKTRCFTLFATHYHELTRLPSLHPGVIVNCHAAASVVDGQLVLLRQIVPGPATHSLGLHIARLADLPETLLQYAETKQAELEVNLFEMESAMKSKELSEGQEIIKEFLRKCKEIEKSTSSDEIMIQKINELKKELLEQNNKYVESLVN